VTAAMSVVLLVARTNPALLDEVHRL